MHRESIQKDTNWKTWIDTNLKIDTNCRIPMRYIPLEPYEDWTQYLSLGNSFYSFRDMFLWSVHNYKKNTLGHRNFVVVLFYWENWIQLVLLHGVLRCKKQVYARVKIKRTMLVAIDIKTDTGSSRFLHWWA